MDAGMTQAEVVEGFAQSAEFIVATAEDVTDWIRAQGIDDVITGDASSDLLAGGFRADRFVFTGESGADTVLDLEPWDSLDLQAFGYASDAEARARFSQQGSSVVFDDGAATEVTFLSAELAEFTDEMLLV